jgi:hypothetical protein
MSAAVSLLYLSTLKTEVVCLSETLLWSYQSTWHYNPEEYHQNLHRRENLRPHMTNNRPHRRDVAGYWGADCKCVAYKLRRYAMTREYQACQSKAHRGTLCRAWEKPQIWATILHRDLSRVRDTAKQYVHTVKVALSWAVVLRSLV